MTIWSIKLQVKLDIDDPIEAMRTVENHLGNWAGECHVHSATAEPKFIGPLPDPRPDETFGTHVRATRLRFTWFKPGKFYVRMSGDGPFIAELCPPNSSMLGKFKADGEYRVGVTSEMLEMSSALMSIKNLAAPRTITIDDNGEMGVDLDPVRKAVGDAIREGCVPIIGEKDGKEFVSAVGGGVQMMSKEAFDSFAKDPLLYASYDTGRACEKCRYFRLMRDPSGLSVVGNCSKRAHQMPVWGSCTLFEEDL